MFSPDIAIGRHLSFCLRLLHLIANQHFFSFPFPTLIIAHSICQLAGSLGGKPLPPPSKLFFPSLWKKKNLCLNDSNDRIDLLLFRHLLAAALPPQPIGDLLPCLSFFSHFSSFLFIPLAVCTLAAISAQLYWWQLQIGKAKGRRNKREKESRQLKVRLWRMQ